MEKPKQFFVPGEFVKLRLKENPALARHIESLGYKKDTIFVIRKILKDEIFIAGIHMVDKHGISITKEESQNFAEYLEKVSRVQINKKLN
jgi:hypothetical protein